MAEEREVYQGAEGFREWAEAQVSQQNQMFGSLLDQHSALYRWILAARLSVNGAAALATLSSKEIDLRTALIASFLFIGGVVLAIIAAELDQNGVQSAFRGNVDALGFWSKAAATGKFDATRLKEIGEAAGVDAAAAKPGKIVGNASLVFFILGAIVAVIGLASCPGNCLVCSG